MATKEADARMAWECMTRFFLADENQRRFTEIAEQEGVTVRLLHATLDLDPAEPKPMRFLAEQWFCDASNVTSVIDGLEDRGLVVRDVSPTDRRVKLIRLTAKGVALRERTRQRLLTPPAGLLDLSAADLRTLRELLEKAAAGYVWPALADRH